MKKILIVDDEEHIVELLKYNIEAEGYETITASNGAEALEKVEKEKPDLILLDLMLPVINGIEVAKEIKSKSNLSDISIIMLTAKSEEDDKIKGLNLGADDYITKPFSVKELLARVNAVLRRTAKDKEDVEEISDFGRLKINNVRHEVIVDNKIINMTLKEYELLSILVKNKDKILEREKLLEKVWGYQQALETRTVDVHIRYLRKKIEVDDKNPKYIETIRGIGYRFNSKEK